MCTYMTSEEPRVRYYTRRGSFKHNTGRSGWETYKAFSSLPWELELALWRRYKTEPWSELSGGRCRKEPWSDFFLRSVRTLGVRDGSVRRERKRRVGAGGGRGGGYSVIIVWAAMILENRSLYKSVTLEYKHNANGKFLHLTSDGCQSKHRCTKNYCTKLYSG